MTPERWKQIDKLLQAALDLRLSQRAAFLDEHCAGDQPLRREVQSLLASGITSFLERAAFDVTTEVVPTNGSGESDGATVLIGKTLGQYKILKVLGAGGMGQVYLAQDTKLPRKVAIKVLSPEFTKDQQLVKRFRQEAYAASALTHQNILTIHDISVVDSLHFIAMEFIDGESLCDRISRGPLMLDEAIDIAVQIATGLNCAHKAGLLHRDIKSRNIMVRPDGHVKVIDFGLAKLFERQPESPRLTMVDTAPGIMMGTPSYMSPEQINGLPLDQRSDIFSFGILLYEIFARQLPFGGSNIGDIIAAILTEREMPLSQRAPTVPRDLDRIVGKALQKTPDDRYQTIQELLSDLLALKRRLEKRSAPDEGGPFEVFQPDAPIESQPDPSFIGRETELAEVGRLLLKEETRLLTLTGTGGVGKTRLAEQVAARVADQFTDGMYFISLASIKEPALVTAAIAQGIGLKESAGQPLSIQVKRKLQHKRALLVLDNFEQVIPATPLITELIGYCPRLKVLVTSRTLLHTHDEREFEVTPLELPDLEQADSLDYLKTCTSVLLFADRSKFAGFVVTTENARTVAEICVRLDGIPLAIELAAPRIRILSPQEILLRLSNRLGLLTRGLSNLPARQRTMRAAIEWSYDLLRKEERSLFRQLAVFVDGFSLEAAESVCDEPPGMSVLDGISSLLDNSLLRRPVGATRFVMLETLREFALERLTKPKGVELKETHGDFFVRLAEQAEPELTGNGQSKWLNLLEADRENLRAALSWSIETSKVEMGLRIAAAIWRFWEVHGPLSEGRRWLKELLVKLPKNLPNCVVAKALYSAGVLAHIQSDYVEASPLLEQALFLYRSLDDDHRLADTLNELGLLLHDRGDNDRAVRLLQEGLALSRREDYERGMAYALDNLGHLARDRGDYPDSRVLHKESLEIRRKIGDDFAIAASTNNLALVALAQGDLESAASSFEESRKLFQFMGNKLGEAISLNNLGEVAELQGDYELAATLFSRSLTLFRREDDTANVATVLKNMGNLARRDQDSKKAKTLYAESLTLLNDVGQSAIIASCLAGLAGLACAQEELERAAQLFGAAEAICRSVEISLPPAHRTEYERDLAHLRSALPPGALSAAWSRGEQMTMEQVMAYALE